LTDLGYSWLKVVLELSALVVTSLISYISYKGFSTTKRPVFARLSIAFISISLNFLLISLADILGIFEYVSLFYYLQLGASFFEMIGFFFLFFSHMVKVYKEQIALASLVIFNPIMAFKTLAVYFISYTALETAISYLRNRSRIVLLTSIGLSCFAIQSILGWMSELIPYSSYLELLPIMIQMIGIIILLVPIWIYYRSVKL